MGTHPIDAKRLALRAHHVPVHAIVAIVSLAVDPLAWLTKARRLALMPAICTVPPNDHPQSSVAVRKISRGIGVFSVARATGFFVAAGFSVRTFIRAAI